MTDEGSAGRALGGRGGGNQVGGSEEAWQMGVQVSAEGTETDGNFLKQHPPSAGQRDAR